jgi:hypothetical protein
MDVAIEDMRDTPANNTNIRAVTEAFGLTEREIQDSEHENGGDFSKADGNRPLEPQAVEVEFFLMEEFHSEKVKIHGWSDHGRRQAPRRWFCGH